MTRDLRTPLLVIVGPTGAQKTATFKEYSLQRNHGSTRWFEAPENGAMMEFVTRLAGDMSAQTASDKKKAHLLKALKPSMLIIIDNAHYLGARDFEERSESFTPFVRASIEAECITEKQKEAEAVALLQQVLP